MSADPKAPSEDPPGVDALIQRLDELLSGDEAAAHLTAYFAEPPTVTRAAAFQGRHFERLQGGGDRADISHRVTAADLVAVQMLAVTVHPEVSADLLEGHLGVEVHQLLRQVPVDVDLADQAAAPHVATGSPADRCWQLLVAQHDVGPTTAGKLLARKRPRLVPIYDDVVACALGHPGQFWLTLHHALNRSDRILRRVDELQASTPTGTTALRVLDIVVWMSHRHVHRASCPRRATRSRPRP